MFLLRISYQIITNDYKPVKIKYFLSLKKKGFQSQEKEIKAAPYGIPPPPCFTIKAEDMGSVY